MSAPAHARNEGPGGCVPWDTYMVLMRCAVSAEAENERLREALRDLVHAGEPFVGLYQPVGLRIYNRWLAAMIDGRRALEASSEPRP